MTDLETLKAKLLRPEYLRQYLERTGRGSPGASGVLRCPFPSRHANGDAHPSAHFYEGPDKAHINCFSCHGNWDIFALCEEDEKLDFMGAIERLAGMFSLEYPSRLGKCQTPTPQRSADVESYLAECAKRIGDKAAAEYLASRGISLETAKRLGMGFDPAERSTKAPAIIFPEAGGYGTRDLTAPGSKGKNCRHLPAGSSGGSSFNLGALWGEGAVFIVEGQFDAAAIEEAGGHAVALGGINHTREIIEAAKRKTPRASIIVALDFEADEKTRANVAAAREKLVKGLREAGAIVYVPEGENIFGAHDANDALLADAEALRDRISGIERDALETRERLEAIREPAPGVYSKHLSTFADIPPPVPEEENPDALLENGFFRKGHVLTIVSCAGQGKSVLANQLALSWAAGRSCFLPKPFRPLTGLVIQYEDDITEMSEFVRDYAIGFKRDGWTDEEIAEARKRVSVLDVRSLRRDLKAPVADETLAKVIGELQHERHFDFIIINPLTSGLVEYDLSDNADANRILKNILEPVLEAPDTKFGLVLIHHTGKVPKSQAERENFMRGTYAQYDARGAAVLMDWTRASLMIAPTDRFGDFVLVGAKRKSRLGWKDATGLPTSEKCISYSPDICYWIDTPADRIEAAKAEKEARDDRNGVKKYDPLQDACGAAVLLKDGVRKMGHGIPAKEARMALQAKFGCARGNKAWNLIREHPENYDLTVEKAGRFEYYGGPPPGTGASVREAETIDEYDF